MTEESNSNFQESEELNRKMADAVDAFGDIHKKLIDVFFREKTGYENNVVPFKKRKIRI